MDDGAVLEEQDSAGTSLPYTNTQLRFLTPHRTFAGRPADVGAEPSHQVKDLTAIRSVAAHDIADLCPGLRHSKVGAPYGPVKLGWKPLRAPSFPVRQRHAANREHGGIRVAVSEVLKPVRIGDRVIVKESDDIATRHGYPCVPAPRETLGLSIFKDDNVRHLSNK